MFVDHHLERLGRSVAGGLGDAHAAGALRTARQCVAAMRSAFAGRPRGRLRVLLALDAAGERWQALGEWGLLRSQPDSLATGIAAITASLAHPGLGVLGKSASYHWSMAARNEALARGAGEALLARDGRLLEGATGALVWRQGGGWFASGSPEVLPSVTLAQLREMGTPIGTGDLSMDALSAGASDPVEGLVLVSALRLAVAIREIDGRTLPVTAAQEAAAQWRDRLLARHAAPSA